MITKQQAIKKVNHIQEKIDLLSEENPNCIEIDGLCYERDSLICDYEIFDF